jgi:hypothetical protein
MRVAILDEVEEDGQARPSIAADQKLYLEVRALLGSVGLAEFATDAPRDQPQFNALFVRRDLAPGMRLQLSSCLATARGRFLIGRAIRAMAGRMKRQPSG